MKCCGSYLSNWLRRGWNRRWNWNISSRSNWLCRRINAQSTHDGRRRNGARSGRDHCHGNCGRLIRKMPRQKIICRVRAVHATTRTRDTHRHPPPDRFHVEFIFRAAAAKDFEFHNFFRVESGTASCRDNTPKKNRVHNFCATNSLLLSVNPFYFARRKWL